MHGLHFVALDAIAELVSLANVEPPLGRTLFGGAAEPAVGLADIPADAVARHVFLAENNLRTDKPLFGRTLKPRYGLLHILWDAIAVIIKQPEIILRLGVSQLRGGLEKPEGLVHVQRNIFPRSVPQGQTALGRRETAVGRTPAPVDRLIDIFVKIFALEEQIGKRKLRFGHAAVGSFYEKVQPLLPVLRRIEITACKAVGGLGDAELFGFFIIFARESRAFFNPRAEVVGNTHGIDRLGQALLCGEIHPIGEFLQVGLAALAVLAGHGEVELRAGMAVFGGP